MTAPGEMGWDWEGRFAGIVAGVDEAGRGPLAGPVVAAAVILDRRRCPDGIGDSKKLAAPLRERLHAELCEVACIGIGSASVDEIDRLNIHWATMLAMERAVEALLATGRRPPTHLLVDGNRLPRWQHPATPIVGGDAVCRSIAAASIIAKVTRDREMVALAAQWPAYGWARNKGYGTAEHLRALGKAGPSPHHRQSFAPVRAAMVGEGPPAARA
jgi:ribonuclease HII